MQEEARHLRPMERLYLDASYTVTRGGSRVVFLAGFGGQAQRVYNVQ